MADVHERPVPRLVKLSESDCAIKSVFFMLYAASAASWILDVTNPQKANNVSCAAVTLDEAAGAFSFDVATYAGGRHDGQHIGVSLSVPLVTHILAEAGGSSALSEDNQTISPPLGIALSIEAGGCYDGKNESRPRIFQSKALNLSSRLLVLVQPVHCANYAMTVGFWTGASHPVPGNGSRSRQLAEARGVGPLTVTDAVVPPRSRPSDGSQRGHLVRAQGGAGAGSVGPPEEDEVAGCQSVVVEIAGLQWHEPAALIRALILCVFLLLLVYVTLHFFNGLYSKGWLGLSIGRRTIIILDLGIVLQTDSFFLAVPSLHVWRSCIYNVGLLLHLWSKLQLLSEILWDLNVNVDPCYPARKPRLRDPANPNDPRPPRRLPWIHRIRCLGRCVFSNAKARWAVILAELLFVAAAICQFARFARHVKALSVWSPELESYVCAAIAGMVIREGLITSLIPVALGCWIAVRMAEVSRCLKTYAYSRCRVHYLIFSFFLLSLITDGVTLLLIQGLEWGRQAASQDVSRWSTMNDKAYGALFADTADISPLLIHAISAGLFSFAWGTPYGQGQQSRQPSPDPEAGSPTAPSPASLSEAGSGLPLMELERDTLFCKSSDDPLANVHLGTIRVLAHCAKVVYSEGHIDDALLQAPSTEDEHDLRRSLSALSLAWEPIESDNLDLRALVAVLRQERNGRRWHVGVVVFRGTANFQNVRVDLRWKREPLAASLEMHQAAERAEIGGVMVHQGFQQATLSLREAVMRAVEDLHCNKGCKEIWCCGHSMGGALATLMAPEIALKLSKDRRHRPPRVGLCTFGSPRVGNTAFTELCGRLVQDSVRVVCEADPVANMPMRYTLTDPRDPYGHVHGLTRIFYNGHLITNPTLLEETLRYFIHHTFVFTRCSVHRLNHHQMSSYTRALYEAKCMECQGREAFRSSSSLSTASATPLSTVD